MSANIDDLRRLFVDVAGEDTIIERQEDAVSREPIESIDDPAAEVSNYVKQDGLDDALEGIEVDA